MFEKIYHAVTQIKQHKPLVLNITNDVTMDFIANGLLSLGASPVMSKAEEEMEDLLKLAGALVINLGTLNKQFLGLCEQAFLLANQLKKPIILDPVGAGATRYRTETTLELMNTYDISIVRGNGSEIMSLLDSTIITKGVDSVMQSNHAIESAQQLSARYRTTVVVSGETDVIVDGDDIKLLSYGSSLMPMITGSGCLLSAVMGAFHAVEKDSFTASISAAAFYGKCGEIAAANTQYPGSFKLYFLDALSRLPESQYYAE